MRLPLSLICLLHSGFTFDYPSERGIRKKKLFETKTIVIKTYLRSSLQQERLYFFGDCVH